MSSAPMPPTPRKSGNWLWWILGIAGAAVVLLLVCGLLIAGLFVKSIRVRPREHEVAVRTPAGDLTVSSTPARGVGLPVYPGAALVESGKNIELALPEDKTVGIMVAKYRSSDSLDKVAAWYRARLGPEFKRETGDKEGRIRVHGVMTEGVAYVAEDDDLARVVAISEKFAGVEIALLRIGKREAQ